MLNWLYYFKLTLMLLLGRAFGSGGVVGGCRLQVCFLLAYDRHSSHDPS